MCLVAGEELRWRPAERPNYWTDAAAAAAVDVAAAAADLEVTRVPAIRWRERGKRERFLVYRASMHEEKRLGKIQTPL